MHVVYFPCFLSGKHRQEKKGVCELILESWLGIIFWVYSGFGYLGFFEYSIKVRFYFLMDGGF